MSTVTWIAGDACPLGKLGEIKGTNVVELMWLNHPLLFLPHYCLWIWYVYWHDARVLHTLSEYFRALLDEVTWSGSTPSCHRLFPLVSSGTPSLYCCKAKSQFTGVIHDHTCPVTAPLLTGYSPICVHRWSLPVNDYWWICRHDLKQNAACLVLALVLRQVTPVTPLHHAEFNQGNGRLEDSYFMLPADAAGWSPKLTNHLHKSQCSKIVLMCGSNMPQESLLVIKPLVII